MIKYLIVSLGLLLSGQLVAQCSNFVSDNFDSFEYATVCPYIVPGTTYQSTPQTSPGFGPSHSGSRHIYLNFVNGYTGPAFNRPYDVCVGETYRLSFFHRDAWGGQNNTTFNIYDANNVLLVSQNVPWTGTAWNQWVSAEITATTTTLRLEIVNNSTTGNNDMVVDDMRLEVCSISETRTLLTCNLTANTNLFDLFSAAMPTGGTWSGPSALQNGYLGTYDYTSGVDGIYTYSTNPGSTCAPPEGTVIVSGGTPIDLGDDIHSCTAQATTLNAGTGYDFYSWSTGASTQTINVTNPGTYSVEAGRVGANLVLNGNFQGGTTAASNNFTTSYVPGTGGSWGLLSNAGQFAISTSPSLTHNNFSACGDHTGATGNMFIANGSQTPNTLVWSQTVQVEQNQDYLFSFWAMNVVNDPAVASLQLFINGVPIGAANTTTTFSCQWQQINDTWNSGSATQAVLSIVNQATAEAGNDFAIDDIFFAPYCSFSDTVVVTVANHAMTLNNNQTICQGDSINLVANATSTTGGNFVYHWNNIPDNVSTQWVTPTATTSYTVYATADDGCNTPTRTVSIGLAPRPNPNAGVDDVVCNGESISLVGTVGVMINTRSWSHNVDNITPTPIVTYAPNMTNLTPTITVNESGTYSFILSEQNNACGVYRDTVQVIVSSTTHETIVTDLSCFGNNSGEIEIVNPDGVNYSFDDAANWSTSSTINGLAIGDYTVWSENQYGCRFSSIVTVNQPEPLTITSSNDTLVCENGTALVSANASVNGAMYHWDFTPNTAANQQISPIADSTVSVYAEDANGCLSDTLEIDVTVRAPLSATISPDDIICPGYPTTILVNGINGGLAPYSIEWSTGETGQGTSMNIEVNPPSTEQYSVTISDVCESTPFVLTNEIAVAPLPIPLMSTPDPAICEPANFQLVNETNPDMVGSASWILSDGQFFINQENVLTEDMPAGSYDVQLIVTSPQGCIDSVTYYDFLLVHPEPTANFSWSPNPVRMFNTEVNFANTSFLGNTYEWTFEEGSIGYSNLESPTISFPDGEVGQYEVTLITTSEYGCVDTISRIVDVISEVIIYVPNTFTPDNDEFNQDWGIVVEGLNVSGFNLQVYNRWGEMIWESNDPSSTWDGTYKGQIVPNGTYSWLIQASDFASDAKYTWNGSVNVLR